MLLPSSIDDSAKVGLFMMVFILSCLLINSSLVCVSTLSIMSLVSLVVIY